MDETHGITFGNMERLRVDRHHQLYWDGKPVVTKQVVSLDWWLAVAAVVTAASTLVLALVGIVQLCRG
jgi:hypothetical protein